MGSITGLFVLVIVLLLVIETPKEPITITPTSRSRKIIHRKAVEHA